MLWLDLCLSGFCLWGGVSGYKAGTKRSLRRLAALIATMLTAAFFTRDVKHFITLHYPLDGSIKALIIRRIAIPVGGAAVQGDVFRFAGLPEVIHHAIDAHLPAAATVQMNGFADLLTMVMMNALAFTAAAALWWSAFHLLGCNDSSPRPSAGKSYDYIGAFWAGVIRQALLLVIICGVACPFIWLCGIPAEIIDFQASILIHWSLMFFHSMGIWWS